VGHAVIMLPMVRRGDEGLERKVASSLSPHVFMNTRSKVFV
jgi:hypothetical protein